jgi:glycosyl transferase family 4
VIATASEELVARGHDVTLLASGDSRTSPRLVPVTEQSLWRAQSHIANPAAFAVIGWGRVSREIDSVDIVHSHLGPLGHFFGRLRMSVRPPVVTMLQSRLDLPEIQALQREFADAPVVS